MEIIWNLFVTFLLVGLNAFFVGAEFAAVGARRSKLEAMQPSILQRSALKVKDRLDLFLSTCQFGITVASLGLGFVAEEMLVGLIEPFLSNISGVADSHGLAVVFALCICTALHVSIGEVAPKNAAIQIAEKVLPILALPLIIFTYMFYPLIWLLNEGGNLVLKLFGFETRSGSHEPAHSLSELRNIIEHSMTLDEKQDVSGEILSSVFKFQDLKAKQVMIPRTAIQYISLAEPIEDVLKKIEISPYTRFPLSDGLIDNLIGFVHTKDIVRFLLASKDKYAPETTLSAVLGDLNLSGICRKINKVAWNLPLSKLLRIFQRTKIHMAGVFNEHGSLLGLVTLEDVIEEIVGEINDEFDPDSKRDKAKAH
jgi:CBS domain containing-hemolysin-like protein